MDLLCSRHSRVVEDTPALILSLRNTPVVPSAGPSRVGDDSRQPVDAVSLISTFPVFVEVQGGGELYGMLVLPSKSVEPFHLQDHDVGGVSNLTKSLLASGRILALIASVAFDGVGKVLVQVL